ncbi:hypothetical protein GCM10027073_35400 [Streptomyces chlorus]
MGRKVLRPHIRDGGSRIGGYARPAMGKRGPEWGGAPGRAVGVAPIERGDGENDTSLYVPSRKCALCIGNNLGVRTPRSGAVPGATMNAMTAPTAGPLPTPSDIPGRGC